MAKKLTLDERAARVKPKRYRNGVVPWDKVAEKKDPVRWEEIRRFLEGWSRDGEGEGKRVSLRNKEELYDFIVLEELKQFSPKLPARTTFSKYMMELERRNVT